jgi:hypothetical protein
LEVSAIKIISQIKILLGWVIVIAFFAYFVLLPLSLFVYVVFVPPIEDFFNNRPITSDFDFTTAGYSKEFKFRTLFWSYFELVMKCDQPYFAKEYNFQGKILLELYSKNQLLQKEELETIKRKYYIGKDLEHFSALSLTKIFIPLKYRFNKELIVKLTVLKPDQQLQEYKNVKVGISRIIK